MLLNSQPHLSPALKSRMDSRVGVKRRLVGPTEFRQVLEHGHNGNTLEIENLSVMLAPKAQKVLGPLK